MMWLLQNFASNDCKFSFRGNYQNFRIKIHRKIWTKFCCVIEYIPCVQNKFKEKILFSKVHPPVKFVYSESQTNLTFVAFQCPFVPSVICDLSILQKLEIERSRNVMQANEGKRKKQRMQSTSFLSHRQSMPCRKRTVQGDKKNTLLQTTMLSYTDKRK